MEIEEAVARQKRGDFSGAVAACDALLRGGAPNAPLYYCRGTSLAMLGRLGEAMADFEHCLALDPAHLPARYNQALGLIHLQRWPAALEVLDHLVQREPGMADAWNDRAGVLQALGRWEEALDSIRRVLALRPHDSRALYNAGILLLTLNRFEEAKDMLAMAVERDPHHPHALGSLLSAALRACDWEMLERILPMLLAKLRDGRAILAPLTLLALSDDAGLQRRCAEQNLAHALAATELARQTPPPMAVQVHDRKPIRIGYLSSDFRDHPVAGQIAGLLERHDRSQFEVMAFSIGRDDGSDRRRRIVQACDRFFDLASLGSREAAAVIRDAQTDILIDLNGPTLGWRPAILKYRPAPVIATYLGYAGTMGADFVDYIIGDGMVTPFRLTPAFSEKIVQLPGSFWPADPQMPAPEPVSRTELGLPENAFVFCCFNANHKIRPAIFDTWARLMSNIPHSLLWLRDSGPAINARFRAAMERHGLDPARLHFAGRMESLARHLGRQAQADLFLDTWPYNAHVTAADALWAGLPLVTLRGESFVSRVAASLLSQLELGELIAASLEDYEGIALSLAQEPARLADLRVRLAASRGKLADIDPLVGGMEAAYRQMHARSRRGEPPAEIQIPAILPDPLSI
jgi:predicted O-linked N-acetylglucosamine transferase (SPINDLY family)